MGFLFDTQKKEKLVAIFDIGSGSVGGAFVKIFDNKEKLPEIIKTVRIDIKNREKADFDLLLNDMILTLKSASYELYQSKLGAPEEIFCVLASPWYTSESKLIKISKNNPITFNARLVNDLVKKEISSFENRNGRDDNLEIIESPIIGISLDGVSVDNLIDKKGNSLEVNMVISIAHKICLDKIKEVISKDFHDTKVSFSSFMLASYLSVRDRYMNHDSYMLIDIGGEVTDVGIVSDTLLKDSFSFPYGRNTFFRNLSQELQIELRDVHELFNLFSSKNLSEEKSKNFSRSLNNIEMLWRKDFKDCLLSLPKDILPKALFLTIDFDIEDIFSKAIKEEYFRSITLDKDFVLKTIDGPVFLSMCDIKNGTCDPFLMIEAVSIMRKI